MLSAAAAPVRSLVAAALFAASIFNRVFKSFGFYRIKSGLSNLSLRTLSKQLVSFSLIFSILTTSTPAASTVPTVTTGLMIGLGEIGQDIRYAYLSSNPGINFFSSGIFNYLFKKSSGKKQSAIYKVVILPAGDGENGGITVLQGEKINFSAVGVGGDAQPVNGLAFKWAVTDTTRNRPARALQNGNFTAYAPGVFILTAETQGKQAQVNITVNPNEGYGLQKMLQKPEAEKSDKQKQQVIELKQKGILITREISSKAAYRIEDEKQLDQVDKQKQKEAKAKQNERRQKNPNPLQNPKQNPSQNPNGNNGNQPPRGGPNAGDEESDYRAAISEDQATKTSPAETSRPAAKSAAVNPAAKARPVDDPVWDGGNWSAADDPVNQVGTPAGAAPAAGAGNGNFQIAAPVVSLSGRAGLGVNLALVYNSRLWSKAGNYVYYDADKSFPSPGWSLGFGKMMRMGGTGGCMMVDPDGTRHSYTGTNSTYSSGSYYSDSYTGYTTDNSFIDYSCSYSSSTYGTYLSGSALLANGTTISYTSPTGVYDQVFPTQITDAQGNYMTITYVNNQGPNIQTITDNLGRVVTFNYDSSNRLINITGPGQGGSTRTLVRLHYRQLSLSYAFAPGIYPDTPTNTPYVLDAVYYPDTNTGYWFGDSDSYSSYGMIAKVVEARGMSWSGVSGDQGTVTPGTMSRQRVYNFTLTPDSSLTDAPSYTTATETWANMDTAAAVTNFSVSNTSTDEIITVTAPNGTKSRQTSHNDPGQYDDGMYYQNETLAPDGTTLLGKMKTFLAAGAYGSSRPTRIESTDEKGQMTAQEFSYGTLYNQMTEQREYNYAGGMYRKVNTTYENNGNYTGRHIFNLVKTTEMYDANNVRISRADYEYDNNAAQNGTGSPNLVSAPGVVMHNYTSDPFTSQTQDGRLLIRGI